MMLEHTTAERYKRVCAENYFSCHGARFAVHRSLFSDRAWAVTDVAFGITVVDGASTADDAQTLARRLLRAEDVVRWTLAAARLVRH